MYRISIAGISFLMTVMALMSIGTATADERNDATAATKAANDAVYKKLPFGDMESFKNAHKGLIAPLPNTVIKGKAGNVIWDPNKYGFIKEGDKVPDTVNPSLWRQSKLINISGLFEVTDGIYQIRNYDLSKYDDHRR